MIDFSDIDYVVAFWFVDGMARRAQDFLACVFRDKEGDWRATYRFRYANSNEAFDAKDIKNWYAVKAKAGDHDPARTLAEAMDSAAARLVATGYCDLADSHKAAVNGDAKLAWEVLAAQPWVNFKIEGAGDAPVNTNQRGSA